jgi:hypothetical protein
VTVVALRIFELLRRERQMRARVRPGGPHLELELVAALAALGADEVISERRSGERAEHERGER